MPAPCGMRRTIGQLSRPGVRVRSLEAWFTNWSRKGTMNPMNWISPPALSPWAAMPTQTALIKSSDSGMSITRSGPKRCCRETVARNTPPFTPTSSPSTITLGSSCIARASARLTASTSVDSGMGAPLQLVALGGVGPGKFRIKVIEHRLRRTWPHRQVPFRCRLDLLLTLAHQLFLLRLAPCPLADEIRTQPRNRLLLPAPLNLLGRAIAPRVIRGGVVAEPVGRRLDEARALPVAGRRNRLRGGSAHRDDVVAVDLFPSKAGGDRLLRQRFGGRLQLERHGYGPLIVVGDEHQGELMHAGKIHCFPQVALRRGAVAEQANRDPRLFSKLECISNPGSMRRLRTDRNAIGKIMSRTGGVVAALVAAPVEQDLLHLHPAPQQGGVVAIGRQQDIFLSHCACDPDPDRLLAEPDRVGAKAPGALKRDRLQVKGARQHHCAIEGDEKRHIRGETGQPSQACAVGREVRAAANLKTSNDRKLFICR